MQVKTKYVAQKSSKKDKNQYQTVDSGLEIEVQHFQRTIMLHDFTALYLGIYPKMSQVHKDVRMRMSNIALFKIMQKLNSKCP